MDSLWSTSVWTVYYKEWCVSWNQKIQFFYFQRLMNKQFLVNWEFNENVVIRSRISK